MVRWGARRYLVADEELASFANQVNSGFEPQRLVRPRQLWRLGNEKLGVRGLPDGPAALTSRLLREPLSAVVTEIVEQRVIEEPPREPGSAPDRRRLSRLRIDAGLPKGVWPGMELFFVNPATDARVRVTSSDASGAVVEVEEWRADGQPAPQVGWRLSSRHPDAVRSIDTDPTHTE